MRLDYASGLQLAKLLNREAQALAPSVPSRLPVGQLGFGGEPESRGRHVRIMVLCAYSQLAAFLMEGLPGNLGICREVTVRVGPRLGLGLRLPAPGEPGAQ